MIEAVATSNPRCTQAHKRYKSISADITFLSQQLEHVDSLDRETLDVLLAKERTITSAIQEIRDRVLIGLDIELRDKIAREHDFSYVTAFSSKGIAGARPRDNWTIMMLIDKNGNTVHEVDARHFEMNHNMQNIYKAELEFADDAFVINIEIQNDLNGRMELSCFYFDAAGKKIEDIYLAEGEKFHEGKAVVTDSKNQSYIMDKEGKRIPFPPGTVKLGTAFHEGRLLVGQAGTPKLPYGYLDSDGHVAIESEYLMRARDFSEGLAAVQAGITSKWKFIDVEGRNAMPELDTYAFEDLASFSGGIALGEVEDRIYILRKGEAPQDITDVAKSVGGIQDEHVRQLIRRTEVSEGVILIEKVYTDKDKKQQLRTYYLNERGAVLPTPAAGQGGLFHEGRAWIKNKDTYQYIDKSGKVISKEIYVSGGDFDHGVAYVRKDRLNLAIDKHGHEVFGKKD